MDIIAVIKKVAWPSLAKQVIEQTTLTTIENTTEITITIQVLIITTVRQQVDGTQTIIIIIIQISEETITIFITKTLINTIKTIECL